MVLITPNHKVVRGLNMLPHVAAMWKTLYYIEERTRETWRRKRMRKETGENVAIH